MAFRDPQTRLRGLLELTSQLTQALDTAAVARVVIDEAQAFVGAMVAMLWIVDDPPTHATLTRAVGAPESTRAQYARIPLESWLPMGDALLRREPLFLESRAEFRSRYERAANAPRPADHDLSYACLPLVAHGRAIAGLALVFPHAREFDDDERMFLTVLARHAAQALERSRLFECEMRARRRLESLQQLTAGLSAAVTVERVAALVTRAGVEALGFAAGVLWVTDEHGDLHVASEHGMTAADRTTFARIPRDSALPVARVARDRLPRWCESDADVAMEQPAVIAVLRRNDAVRGYCALPLVRDDHVLGVMVFSAGPPRPFLPEDRAFMTTIAAHCADAIARARLHDDARSAKQLLQSVLERMPVGVMVSRAPDSSLVLSNDALARIWRVDSFPTRGEDRCKVMNASYPDGRPIPMSESPVVRALRGERVDGLEARIERSDGSLGWIQVSSAPVLREDGSVDVAVAAFIDITAEKEARAAADEADRAKDEFLAMLGHELRNPLTPIVTALDVMDLHGGEAFRAERTMISRQLRHVVRLVDDLLDISRITRGEVALKKELVEIARPIASAIETASPLFEQRAQSLTVSVPERGLSVVVDPVRLAQAVANLLTNASKYTEPGGKIEITAERDAGDVRIRVRDTGIGIEPGMLAKVFDPFVQVERSLDRSRGGLGIGLTVVRNLVELHGGSVSAKSDGIGTGSEFAMRLPFVAGDPSAAASEIARPIQPGGERRLRVLVVDDNRDLADALVEVLELLGCVVHVAYDGPNAIAAADSFKPDLALLDIGLPVMDGYQLARHFRRTPTTSAMRLVAVTGYGRATDAQQAAEAGFDEHVVKPLEIAKLLEVLARAGALL